MGAIPDIARTYFKIKEGNVVFNIKDAYIDNYAYLFANANRVEKTENKNGVTVHNLYFRAYEGRLKNIATATMTFNNVEQKQWLFTFEDENGEAIWATYHDSMLAQGFINCIASAQELGTVRVVAYTKGDNTRVLVYNDGNQLSWAYTPSEIPPLVPMTVLDKKTGKEIPFINKQTGRQQFDNEDRLRFYDDLAEQIRVRLLHTSREVTVDDESNF